MRMKKKDMREAMAAGTVVAVDVNWDQDRVPSSARRAVITGLDALRRVHSGARWDFGGHASRDGVRVRYEIPRDHDELHRPLLKLSSSYSGRGTEYETDTEDCVVPPKEILGTWDEYEKALAAQTERETKIKESRQSAEAHCKDLARRLTELGFKAEADHYVSPYNRQDSSGVWRGVTLSRSQAQELVQFLESTR